MKKGFILGFGLFLAGAVLAVNVGDISSKSEGDLVTAEDFNSIVGTLQGIENTSGSVSVGGNLSTTGTFAATSTGSFGGTVTITSGNLSVSSGDVTANAFLYNSDANLKQDIEPIAGLDTVLALNGVGFAWKANGEKTAGVLAQDVETVLPELVRTADSGYKSVNYGGLIAALIEAIKEQQGQIDQLQTELDVLRVHEL